MAKTKIPFRQRSPLFDQIHPIPIHYLGWSQPILHSACDFLQKQYCRGNLWDLDRCLLVLPGSFAMRRLSQLLAKRAQEQSLVLRPPEFITLGTLPEHLYAAKLPFANDLVQVMAWTKVLRAMPAEDLAPLLFEVPAANELRPWMDLGRILSSLHRELASDLVDFDDVAEELKGTAEQPRWQILARLQRLYLDELRTAGLWDVQSARRYAIDQNEVSTDKEIILLGTVDLNRAQRRFLAAVADNVQVLVGAPESYRDGFDRDGTLVPTFWQDIHIPIDPKNIFVRSNETDAALTLASRLACIGEDRGVEDITVGVPDPSIVPAFQETLGRCGIRLRYGPGTSVTRTGPMQIIDTIEEYLSDGSIESFQTLIRLPMVHQWIRRNVVVPAADNPQAAVPINDDFLNHVDSYIEATLIRSVNIPEWPEHRGTRAVITSILQSTDQWLMPLRTQRDSLSAWAEPLQRIFHSLYADVTVSPDDPIGHQYIRASSEIKNVLQKLEALPNNLDISVSLREAIIWLHNELQNVSVPPPTDDQAIEMVGWLDLALDDTPVLFLTGMHDGVVPESVNGDAFLPNQLRSELGLMDNARRFARDCYAMMTMLHVREQLEILINHLSLDGDAQTPSRLLLAVPMEQLATRVQLLLHPTEIEIEQSVAETWIPKAGQTNIPIPKPEPGVTVADMAVTDFKKYSYCPYRFYLDRIKKVRATEHMHLELDGGGFGDLLHVCLEKLIHSPVAKSADSDAIAKWLTEQLLVDARAKFGVSPPPALQVQIEQAIRRLEAFAIHQARKAEEGWEIKYIEHKVDRKDGIVLQVGEKQMIVHGRIDRIDYHEKDDRYAVWDYKTGDSSGHPYDVHLKKDQWTDWQLPLYGLLVQKLNITDLRKVSFGYILLPKNYQETRFITADFTLEQHAAAIESAKEIAAKVLAGEFWPPKYRGIPEDDDYNAITQLSVPRRWNEEIAAAENSANQTTDTYEAKNSSNSSEETRSHDSSEAPINTQLHLASSTKESQSPQSVRKKSNTKNSKRSIPKPEKLRLTVHQASGEANPDWFSPAMILASAGTGKTYNLAARALRLLFTDQELDSILATTFTRKAAGEILHRVLSWLADAVEGDEGFERLTSILSPLQITRDTVRYQLGRLCAHLHRFRVSTLDSFYSQLARSFALELKLPPGWSLADPFQFEQLQHEAINRLFDTMDKGALKSLISQLSKGEATRGIRREIENVVTNGYDFFRKTTPEAWEKLVVPKGPTPQDVDQALATFAASTLGHKGFAGARDKLLQQFNAGNWSEFLGATLVTNSEADVPTYNRKELPIETIRSLQILAKKAITEELAIRRSQNEAAFRLLSTYDTALREVKTQRRIVTFDDIAERLAKWMQETIEQHRHNASDPVSNTTSKRSPAVASSSSEAPANDEVHQATMQSIAFRMDCPVNHLLLDEFQDTSPMQWNIVKPFAEAIVYGATREKQHSFFCVGDSKQAIYGWRGGVAEIFESVGQQIDRVKKEQLVKSYRSSPVIIDFVNAVFSQLDRHPTYYNSDESEADSSDIEAVTNWTQRHFTAHETSRTELPGYIEFRNANIEKASYNQSVEESAFGLFDEVAERIAELHRSAPHIEIGVLTRTNRDVGKIIGLLRDQGIEASQEGGNPLTDSAAVLLIMSVLRCANHPSDTLSYFHVMNSPFADAIPQAKTLTPNDFSAVLREQFCLAGFGPSVGNLADLLAPHCNQRDQDRLKQFVQLAYRFDLLQSNRIQDFLEYIERQKVSVPGLSPVRVMTIHQSKGLEFDAVFMPTLDQSIVSRAPTFVPMYDDRTQPPIGITRYINRATQRYLSDAWKIAFMEFGNQQLAEALCVFYVAITRARQALYLYTAPASKPSKRWGSVLHSIFAAPGLSETPNQILYQSGSEDWFNHNRPESDASPTPATNKRTEHSLIATDVTAGSADESSVPSRSSSAPTKTIRLRSHSNAPKNLMPLRPSITELERHEKTNLNETFDLSKLWLSEDKTGAIIGKLVHRWFEEIRGWIEDFKLNKKRLREIASATLTIEEISQIRLDELIERFVGYCGLASVNEALSSQRVQSWNSPRILRIEITNERRLLKVVDGHLLRGVIDRCVLGWDGDKVVRAEIIDFKTDQRPESMPLEQWRENRIEQHGQQMRYYRRVLCDQFGIPLSSVKLTLLMLSADKIFEVV